MTRAAVVAILFAGASLAGCAAVPPSYAVSGLPRLTAADSEALYNSRFDAMLKAGGEMTSYDPVETVPGDDRSRLVGDAPTQRTISADALDAAEAYAAANNSSALIVWRDGRVERERYFGGLDASSPIVSKSLAKPITAVAIGRAIALGKIASLDQPVADFIPEWRGTPKAAMTVRHLLDMRSGLLAQGFSTDRENHWSRAYIGTDHGRYIIENYPMTDPPGSVYQYSNATSELVALVIERATGRRYAEFVGNEILRPIGAPGGTVWIDQPGGLAHSGCCIMLPAQSYLRLAALLLDDGVAGGKRLLPPGYVTAMLRPTAQNPHYGLGLWVAGDYVERRGFGNPDLPLPKVLHSEPYEAADLFLFDGNSNQVVYVIPSQRLVILRTGATPPKSPEWDNSRLPNLILRGIERRAGQPAPTPQPRG